MAARYWVGGTGTWNAVNTANWSATSGGLGGATVPTSSDNIIFNASSGGGIVTLGINGICTIIDFTGFTGTIDFVNTYKISCVSSGTTIITAGTTTTFSNTPRFDLTYSGGVGTRTINCSIEEANALSFYITAGTDTIAAISRAKTVDFTGFAGTWAGNSVLFGNLVISTGMTLTASTNLLIFRATSGTQQITTNGKLFDFPIFKQNAGTLQFQDNLTMGSIRTFTLSAGTLDLSNGNRTLSAGIFSSSNSNVRSIAFGTGNITTTGSGTVWDTSTLTSFSRTGTPTVNISNNSATATTVSTGAMIEAQSLDFNYTTGAYTLTDTASVYRSVNFTGFAGTIPNSVRTIYGNATFSAGMTLTAGANATSFLATSGTQQITTNGKTLDFPITQNGVGGTVQLQDNLTMGSTRTYTLTNGALDLSVGNRTLSTGIWNSTNSNVRSIAFGTGKIVLTQNAATIWNQSTSTNFSYTGTSRVECTYAGSTGTRALATARTANGGTETNSINFYVTAGSDIVSFSSTSYLAKTMDFTGFSGSFTPNGCFFYNDLVISSGMSLNSSATLGLGFIGSTPQLVTTANKTFDFPLTFGTASLAPTVVFQDALTQGSTRSFTITNGTVQLKNNVTSTVGSFVATNSISKFLQSTTPGLQATLSQASGTVNVVDLTIRDINAVGGASWNAYTDFENTDAGNNDGWNFSLSPPYSTAELPVTLRPFTQPRRF